MKTVRRAAYAAFTVACLHLVFGAIVRISGSGMGCGPHWPKCYGYWFPPMSRPDLVIEVMHRYLASVLLLSLIALVVVARRHRDEPGVGGRGGVLRSASWALALGFGAALLGALTVKLGNATFATLAHWTVAMSLVATVTASVIRAGGLGGTQARLGGASRRARRGTVAAAALALAAVVMGGLTAKYPGAAVACQSFLPFCTPNPEVIPGAVYVQVTHRWIAVLLVFHLLGLVIGFRKRGEARIVRRAAAVALSLGILQLLVAGAMIGTHLPPVLRSLHEATGVSIWIATVALALLARAASAEVPAPAQSFADDLIALTKPRIISLLLVTTIAPMFVAGSPSWTLVLAVFVGGYLMAGGANAVNMYIDRDIDTEMARTRLRPIPSGRMRPKEVLAFGILCATTATYLLAHVANLLTAVLALGGFYTYILVYTRWLKRSSPQNIVIGGAAGAFPPLVGWAAVTGRVDLLAVYLFLIIFYWTPPHFWALALNKQGDYSRAGVPMAPLIWGERETMRNMLWYTLILVPLTLLPVAFGALGPAYFVIAALLDAWLLVGVLRVMRAEQFAKPAWSLYKFSLLYLALLFAAMVVDRAIGVSTIPGLRR